MNLTLKLWLAYWPSQWQVATDNETVVDIIFGVFSSKERAIESVRASMPVKDWEDFHDQFVYEEVDVDEYHPIPHI